MLHELMEAFNGIINKIVKNGFCSETSEKGGNLPPACYMGYFNRSQEIQCRSVFPICLTLMF